MHQTVIRFAQSGFVNANDRLLQCFCLNECEWKLVEWRSDLYLQLTVLCVMTQKRRFRRSLVTG